MEQEKEIEPFEKTATKKTTFTPQPNGQKWNETMGILYFAQNCIAMHSHTFRVMQTMHKSFANGMKHVP